jgi:mRNA interferase RelE/StbE
MAWKVEFASPALRELDRLDRQVGRRIVAFLHDRVVARGDPRGVGQALKGSSLGELWKYRVGDYRVIAELDDHVMRVLVVRVGNRKDVYR